MENNKTYRIHTGVGSDSPNVINVQLQQTFDMFEILSLKLTQTNDYNFYESSYGIIVGRVLANDAFGISNAKVSVFIPVEDAETIQNKGIYPFSSIRSTDNEGVRYNLLPNEQVSVCHQNVGTFPNKRYVLDNNVIIEVFDKYWKYTTVTNEAGDYMLFGIPTGDQQIHVDVDLSDIGVLSQRPRDMIYKGYNSNMFESPNKFKQSKNLDSLAQIYSQNKGVYVYPYWGDTSDTDDTIAITRCDIQLDYKFEPTCVFMGCVLTDQGENAIGKSCAATEGNGRMEKLMAGEGSIEMIRKTLDGKVEEFQIKGNKLIDGDGVWCYQIPMNLDYVRTDEFGNIVTTDNPDKGIPTRARVRFRFTIDETPNDAKARKRCGYLVPNNPRLDEADYPSFYKSKEIDYEFGSTTLNESYKDLFWNQVYTVKSYIPRLQKNSSETNRKHTGIKAVNYYGDGTNPFPYNNMSIKLSFTYRLICVITKFIIYFVGLINMILSTVSLAFCLITSILKPMTKIPIIGKLVKPLYNLFKAVIFKCIGLGTEFCDDDINRVTYYIGCYGCSWDKTEQEHNEEQLTLEEEERSSASNPGMIAAKDSTLFTCIEQQLAQDNNAVNFNFHNDWINGALYFPLWYRKITPKKSFLFGLFRKKAKDEWCSASRQSKGLRLYHPCALNRNPVSSEQYNNYEGESIIPNYVTSADDCGDKCHEKDITQSINTGVILTRENMYGQPLYYYKAGEYHQELNNNKGGFVPLFATDIVLLGSLNDCDLQGIPQFFKYLTPTTYNMPSNILFTDGNVVFDMDTEGNLSSTFETFTEATGCDWGNINSRDECGRPDGGLFYSIGCSTIEAMTKSCLNLSRICEFGVYLDETKFIENINSETNENDYEKNILIPDGFISFDELYNVDERSMFATLNGNYLRTKLNKRNGLYEYDFRYLYANNFDGSLYAAMESRQTECPNVTYKNNYRLETFSRDYYKFRMGDKPEFYTTENGIKNGLPKYENSYYFYFGLNSGKTAIDKFNSEFFSSCENTEGEYSPIIIESGVNTWCNDTLEDWDGYVKMDLTGILSPYSIRIQNQIDTSIEYVISNLTSERIYFSKEERTEEDFEEYTWIENDNAMIEVAFTNGTYMIEVTDSEGNVSSAILTFDSKYLTYSITGDNFTESNNVLEEEIGDELAIASHEIQSIEMDEDGSKNAEREIGGTIGIYDIYYNNESIFSQDVKIAVTVKPSEKQVINSDDWWCRLYIENGNIINGKNVECAKILTYGETELNLKYIVVGVPKGDVEYTVVVEQYCENDYNNTDPDYTTDTGNKFEASITIGEPIPYKLFINGMDYDIIKNFRTGWTISGNSSNPSIRQSGNIVGWLDIDNMDNYNWELNELYTKDYYLNLGMTDEEADERVLEMKNAFIEDMKRAFYMTCPTQSKKFQFVVQTDYNPVDIRSIYREEEINEDGTLNILSGCNSISSDNMTISGFEIPTITSIDNLTYGDYTYEINDHEGVCWAVDKESTCNGKQRIKYPYFVACVNSNGKTKPFEGISIIKSGDEEYTLDDNNVSGYFGFHVIDKMFTITMLAWSYFNNIPYYKPNNTRKYGQSLTMNGLFTGIINNGVSESDDYMAEFDAQTLGNSMLEIETYKTTNNPVPDENAIPTKRVVVGTENGEYEHYKIILPNIIGDINSDTTYAAVPNKRVELMLNDESCQISEDIYGSMRIVLNSESINDCKDKSNSVLSVSVAGGSDTNTMYAFTTDGSDYIVNKLPDEINSYADYGLMRFEVKEKEEDKQYTTDECLTDYVFTLVESQTEDEEDATILHDTVGYGTTGKFTMKNIGPVELNLKMPIYIIGVSDNNCRCISPVYDYSNVIAQIVLLKQTTVALGTGSGTGTGTSTSTVTTPPTEEGGESTTETVTGNVSVDVSVDTETPITVYKFGIRISNVTELYYFQYYQYRAEITCNAIEGENISGIAIAEKGDDGVVYFEITESVYNRLVSMAENSFQKPLLLAATTVIAEDCTGLRHNCQIDSSIIVRDKEYDAEGNEVGWPDTIL